MSTDSIRLLWGVLAEASVRAIGAALLAALVLAVTRTRAPGVRHAVWASITVAMLAMPLLPHTVPPVQVAALPSAELWSGLSPDVISIAPRDVARQQSSAVLGAPASSSFTGSRLPPAAVPRPINWAGAGAYLYLAGLAASLIYVWAGWLAMAAIVRRSRQIVLPDGAVVYESAIVAAPLTAGVFTPRIILPPGWRAWPAETLRAVVAHERTHILRRDPLIALVARINRCVFWFHPLAWWLERKLAAAAEFACDETASRACGAPAEYAQVLVEMADGVRRNGGRLAWQGIAVSGNGQLKDRIERLLTGRPWPSTSRGKKVLIGCACVLAVALAAASRPTTQARELQPDPAVTERLARQKARGELIEAARALTPEHVAQLEAAVARNPEDLASRERLVIYYADYQRKLDAAAVAARRAHVLWLIEHHPASELAGSWGARLFTTNQDPNPDPDGYAEAKRLWLAQTGMPDVPIAALVNAARFFEVADKPLAEAGYLKAADREPGKWSGELGRLYAITIMGSDASMPLNVLRHVSMTAAHSEYAQQVRRTLETSDDPKLLASAAFYLTSANQFNTMGKTAGSIDFDVEAVALRYVDRVRRLDPDNASAASLLLRQQESERFKRLRALLKDVPVESRPRVVAALPETDRLEFLPMLIQDAYFEGENLDYYKKNKAGAKDAWQRLTVYANDALAIGLRHPEHPSAGAAMFNAHVYLGTIALWDGDVSTARAHLAAAPAVPISDAVKFDGTSASHRLVKYLLKAGEREAVAEFYERMAAFNVRDSDYVLESARAIRAGRMPEWYQMTIEREAGR